MRRLTFAAAALAAVSFATPVLAQDDAAAPSQVMAQMADPATQAQVALMAQALGEILLDMPVAPLLDAMDQMAGEDVATGVDPDARVADLVGPEARDVPAQMAQRIPAMMGAMAALAGAFEQLAPQLRAAAENLPRRQ